MALTTALSSDVLGGFHVACCCGGCGKRFVDSGELDETAMAATVAVDVVDATGSWVALGCGGPQPHDKARITTSR